MLKKRQRLGRGGGHLVRNAVCLLLEELLGSIESSETELTAENLMVGCWLSY